MIVKCNAKECKYNNKNGECNAEIIEIEENWVRDSNMFVESTFFKECMTCEEE